MPDTRITVARDAEMLRMTIRIPWQELLLALPEEMPRHVVGPTEENFSHLRSYFIRHLHVVPEDNPPVPITLHWIRVYESSDEDIGLYREVEVVASTVVRGDVPLMLDYDAVLHRVANHRAIVRDSGCAPVGVVRFSLAQRHATPVVIPLASRASITPADVALPSCAELHAPHHDRR